MSGKNIPMRSTNKGPVSGLDRRQKSRERRNSPIEPALKAWIDNVIVPALVDRWENREAAKAA